MTTDGTTAVVTRYSQCDICHVNQAEFDGKTTMGPWAYMCQGCFTTYGIRLGTGYGQRLIVRS